MKIKALKIALTITIAYGLGIAAFFAVLAGLAIGVEKFFQIKEGDALLIVLLVLFFILSGLVNYDVALKSLEKKKVKVKR